MSTPADVANQSTGSSKPPLDKYVISETQLGIWKLFTSQKGDQGLGLWREIKETYPLIIRLFTDIHKVSPQLLYLNLLSRCWSGVEGSLELRIENILLEQMERAVSSNSKANMRMTLFAIGWKVMHYIMGSYVSWSNQYVLPTLENRLERHFRLEIMNDGLSADLATSMETSGPKVSSSMALLSLDSILSMLQSIFEISSQILLLSRVSRMRGRKMFLTVLLLRVIMGRFSPQPFYKLSFFAYVSNLAYKRGKSLESFGEGRFHQDIVSKNLGNWIITEYRKALEALGDVSTDRVYQQYNQRSSFVNASNNLLGILPSIYFAILAVKYPRRLSIASISTLQASGRTLFANATSMSAKIDRIREGLNTLRTLYAPKTPNIMKDGTLSLTEKGDTGSKGMSLVLKDVSFAYPCGEKKTNSLSGINLDIKAGQLVILVGANGSGKSTLTRILARLYDPSSGEVLIDGRPSTEYRIAELRRATTLLSQDSGVYPLTLAENIGLGYPERSSDLEMIKEVASECGAAEFIEGLENGYQTMLGNFNEATRGRFNGDREHPLWVMSENFNKRSDISGGQRQRLVAARAFMGFRSGGIKLVIIDEPTSALDADAELQLFQRLMSVREGKTMVIVTHRFGHLTKFADQILCMKDGTIVERGSHGELMSADGEYANLYKIQAQAFSEGD